MRKIIISACLLFVFKIASSQVDTTTPPYLRFPTVPTLRLLLEDSVQIFTKDHIPKKNAVAIILFNPDCDHCRHETTLLVNEHEKLKKTTVIMATMSSMEKMRNFINEFNLNSIPNLVVGQDVFFILAPFYKIRSLPFHTFYSKKGELIEVKDGGLSIDRMREILDR